MLQNIASSPIPYTGVVWTISAEWWHYTFAPLMTKISTNKLLIWVLGTFIWYIQVNDWAPFGVVSGIGNLTHGSSILALSWLWVSGFLYRRMGSTKFAFFLLIGPALLRCQLVTQLGCHISSRHLFKFLQIK